MDWDEDIAWGDAGGDPCTSKSCPDSPICAKFEPNAKPTAISNKRKASLGGDCPFFEPLPNRYPQELRHALCVWPDKEEDLQASALAWFLEWREKHPFVLDGEDDGYFATVPDPALWESLKSRMIDWAWLEEGGLDLNKMSNLLRERQLFRWRQVPSRNLKITPSAGVAKEKANVRQQKSSNPGGAGREGRRAEDDAERSDPSPLFAGDFGTLEGRKRR